MSPNPRPNPNITTPSRSVLLRWGRCATPRDLAPLRNSTSLLDPAPLVPYATPLDASSAPLRASPLGHTQATAARQAGSTTTLPILPSVARSRPLSARSLSSPIGRQRRDCKDARWKKLGGYPSPLWFVGKSPCLPFSHAPSLRLATLLVSFCGCARGLGKPTGFGSPSGSGSGADFHPNQGSGAGRVFLSGFGGGSADAPPTPNPTPCHL